MPLFPVLFGPFSFVVKITTIMEPGIESRVHPEEGRSGLGKEAKIKRKSKAKKRRKLPKGRVSAWNMVVRDMAKNDFAPQVGDGGLPTDMKRMEEY